MHFWRTRHLIGIIANVKVANLKTRPCSVQRPVFPEVGQPNPLNYFIYLINCSALGRICALDRAVRS